MNGLPYVVELVEDLADSAKRKVTLRFEGEKEAKAMARDLTRLLANAELTFEDEDASST